MRKTLYTLIFLFPILIFSLHHAFSQADHLCDQPKRWQELIEKDSAVYYRHLELEAFTRNFVKSPQNFESPRIIPVVFHVMHTYGEENISKQQILDAVNILNQDFRKTNPDTNAIIQAFKPLATDSQIEFRLAQLDPQGNCTDGIVRVFTNSSYVASDDIKDLSRWPRSSYLNIWVVGAIESGAAGYAYYPGVGQSRDGIVIRYDYTGGTGTSSVGRMHTLTHEIGHYLNLAHPWGNSNEPGLPENCNIDDEVEDTPLTVGHSSCNLAAVSCGSLDNVQNFMEYSYCTRMFTHGQGTRMQAALSSPVSNRNNLWQEGNLLLTGTHPFYQAMPCIAKADFYTPNKTVCVGAEVSFFDESFNGEVGVWEWFFPGGIPEVSNEPNPIVIYNQEGYYSVHLKVSNQIGSDSIVRYQYLQVLKQDTSFQPPLTEGFNQATFPVFSNNNDFFWIVDQDGNQSWEYTSVTGSDQPGSLVVRNNWNNNGASSSLTSPPIYLPDNTESVLFTFDYAYAQIDSNSSDEFVVYISKDCGKTWQVRFLRSGYFLSSTGGENYLLSFVPTSNQWVSVERDITTNIQPGGYFQVKFELISKEGNNFFLDNINFGIVLRLDEELLGDHQISLFPNPMRSEGVLQIKSAYVDRANLTISSMQGEVIHQEQVNLAPGVNNIPLNRNRNLPDGLYLIEIQTSKGKITKKLVLVT